MPVGMQPRRIIGNHVRIMNGAATVSVSDRSGAFARHWLYCREGRTRSRQLYLPEAPVRRPAESPAWTDSGSLVLFILITEIRLWHFFDASAFFVKEINKEDIT